MLLVVVVVVSDSSHVGQVYKKQGVAMFAHSFTGSFVFIFFTWSYALNANRSSYVQFRPMGDTFNIPVRNSTKVPLQDNQKVVRIPDCAE